MPADGGKIAVSSELGAGTELRIRLPLTPLAPEPACEPLPAPRDVTSAIEHSPKRPFPCRRWLRVLVVDDNHANQVLLRQQLKHLGHEVSVRGNGAEALRALQNQDFDLIITDCQMPLMDGFELTRRLRARGHTLPIWGFTAHATARERSAAWPPAWTSASTSPSAWPGCARPSPASSRAAPMR